MIQSFLQEALVSSSGMGKDVHSLMLFSELNSVLPTLQGGLKDGLGEADMVCDMPKPCKSPDCCQKRFMQIHKEVGLAPHPSFFLWSPSWRCGEVSLCP